MGIAKHPVQLLQGLRRHGIAPVDDLGGELVAIDTATRRIVGGLAFPAPLRAVAADGSVVNVSGTLSGPQLVEKIVQINGRNLDLRAEGINLILNYGDQPGALGKIGTLLGAAEVNILAAQLSQDADGSGATIMLRLDREVPADVLGAIGEAVGATTLELVDLS